MTRARLVSNLLVGLAAAAALLVIAPDEIASQQQEGFPWKHPEPGFGDSEEPIEDLPKDSVPAPDDEPNEIRKKLAEKSTRAYKDALIRSMAAVLNQTQFIEKELLRSKIVDQLDPGQNYIILIPQDGSIKFPLAYYDHDRDSILGFYIFKASIEDLYMYEEYATFETLSKRLVRFNWRLNNERLLVQGEEVWDGCQKENIALLKVERELQVPRRRNFWEYIRDNYLVSKFYSLIHKFELWNILAHELNHEPGGVTLFAPTNKAFERLDKKELEYLERDPQLVKKLIWRHTSVPVLVPMSVWYSNRSDWAYSRFAPRRGLDLPRLRFWNQLGEEMLVEETDSNFISEYKIRSYSISEQTWPLEYAYVKGGIVYLFDSFF